MAFILVYSDTIKFKLFKENSNGSQYACDTRELVGNYCYSLSILLTQNG